MSESIYQTNLPSAIEDREYGKFERDDNGRIRIRTVGILTDEAIQVIALTNFVSTIPTYTRILRTKTGSGEVYLTFKNASNETVGIIVVNLTGPTTYEIYVLLDNFDLFILTESSEIITLEDGDPLLLEAA